jgi:TRAP-type C4-dicarboxylate transport system substrate-binding protein
MVLVTVLACSEPVAQTATPQATPAAQTSTEDKPITLVFAIFEMQNTVQSTGTLVPYMDEVEKRTGGRVKIEPHWNGELVNIMDTYSAVVDGTVDMGYDAPLMHAGLFDMDAINNFSRYDSVCWKPSRVYYELTQQFPELQEQYKDVKCIYNGASCQPAIGTTKKQISKLEDLKGTKILGSSALAGQRFEALGMVPVSVPPSDTFTGLQRGTIDATPLATWMLIDWNEGEVLKYLVNASASTPIFTIIMNNDKWNSLPADIQEILMDLNEWLGDKNDQSQLDAHKKYWDLSISKYNTTFTILPKEELSRWDALDAPVMDKYVEDMEAKGFPAAKIKDAYITLRDKYSAPEYAPDWAEAWGK